MPNRAMALLLVLLASALAYGRFGLPKWFADSGTATASQHELDTLRIEVAALSKANRLLREKLLLNRLASGPTQVPHSLKERYQWLVVSGKPRNDDDLIGQIKAVNDRGQVTVDLGSDSGLAGGESLVVFRAQNRVAYVGMLRVAKVRPNEAVGKPVDRDTAMQVGDYVLADFLGVDGPR